MRRLPRLTTRVMRAVLATALLAAVTPASGIAGNAESRAPGHRERVAETPARAWETRDALRGSGDVDYVDGEILVRFRQGLSVASRASAHAQVGGRRARGFDVVPGLELVEVPRGMAVAEAVGAYRALPGVEYAQPNYRKRLAAITPTDPRFGQLWGLENTGQTGGTAGVDISAVDAWGITTGSDQVVVAVLDTGVDHTHPDLAANMWVNPGEIAGNGIDDDGNGHIDDVHGIDAVGGTGDPDDDHGHGTHVAGTIGAVGNNGTGVTGVNWDVSIMAVKILDADGFGTTANAIDGFEYAAAMGADVISNSWGWEGVSGAVDQAEYDAIAAIDALFVFAAGNEETSNDGATPFYPAAYDLDNIISVGASDHNDARAWFSNYGATSVDVFAPGVDIVSTIPTGKKSFIPDVDQVLFSHDFSATTGWDLGWYEQTPWSRNTSVYTSSPSSIAHLGYLNNEDAYADGPAFGASSAKTVFFNAKARFDLEEGADYLDLWVTHDGATEWWLAGSKTGTSDGEFEDWWIDISRWAAGKSGVRISLGLYSDGKTDSRDGYEGAYVDDVRVVTPVEVGTAFSDTMGTLGNWDVTSMPGNAPWALSESRYTSSPRSLAHTGYLNNEFAVALQRGGVDMSGADAAMLRFKAWHDIEVMGDWFDVVVENSGSLSTLMMRTGDSGGWRTYTGIVEDPGEVAAAFALTSNGAIDSRDGYEGVYVDDVEWVELSGTWVGENDSAAYGSMQGTSMATPHVSGIAALLLSVAPDADWQTLKAAILDSAEPRPALAGLCVTGARADAHAALLTFSTGNAPVTTVTGVPADWYRFPAIVTLDVPGAELAVTTDYRVSRVGGTTGTWVLGATPPVDLVFDQDGEWKLDYRSRDPFGSEAVRSATVRIDKTPPVTTTTANKKTFEGAATVTLTPGDGGLSGVASTRWSLDGGTTWSEGTSIEVAEKGAHTLTYYSVDNAGNVESRRTATFTVTTAYTEIAGNDRILTAVAASRAAFPDGAGTVVIATARNWPDALGGTALAGVLGGPILLAERTSLPAATAAEIAELGAKRAIIVGGKAAIDPKVETALKAALGAGGTIERESGDDRYKTADAIALRVIAEAEASGGFTGSAFFATGANFPDALAAAPLAAGNGWPLFLVHPTRGVLPGTRAAMADVSDAIVLGGTGAVSDAVESGLRTSLQDRVVRLDGDDRWETAVEIASWAVSEAGFEWNGVALTNGRDFPDALAGGVLQGRRGSVMLLTAPTSLSTATGTALTANSDAIAKATFLGGPSAISLAVRNTVREALD